MKLKYFALLFLLSAVAGCAGYYLGAMRENTVTRLPTDATVALDYLVSAESFSEVEHARAVLDALAIRYVNHAQGLIAQELRSRPANFGTREPRPERPIAVAISVLGEAIVEFKGSDQELQLLPPLLYALKRERFYDRWLDVYLSALYQHPTHELVADLADDAVFVSQAVGREKEVAAGFSHLTRIPLDFHTKSRIEHTLVRAGTETQFIANHREHAL